MNIESFYTMVNSQAKADRKFDFLEYPVVDLSSYLTGQTTALTECQTVANLLHKFGFLCVKDPRVNYKHNDEFIDMMEKYYEQKDEIKAKDIRKEASYQVGLTPTHMELARNHCELAAKLDKTERPVTICPPGIFFACLFSELLP